VLTRYELNCVVVFELVDHESIESSASRPLSSKETTSANPGVFVFGDEVDRACRGRRPTVTKLCVQRMLCRRIQIFKFFLGDGIARRLLGDR
jgi:hypothetical protein